MMLTGLADVARKAGLTVKEVPGWQHRGRPGGMVAVYGVTCHHTAGGRTLNPIAGLNTIIHGRSDLPGPLAHFYLARDGVVHVVAAGKCNHAGVSRSHGSRPYTNSYRIGIEAQAAGDGWNEDWPPVQRDAYRRLCRALAEHYGFSVDQVLGHKETCSPPGRKSDPSFGMEVFRDGVRHVTTDPITPGGTDMQWTDKIKLTEMDITNGWGDSDNADTGKPFEAGDMVSVGYMLRYPTLARKTARDQAIRITELENSVEQLGQLVRGMAAAMGIPQPQAVAQAAGEQIHHEAP